jgi:DNA-binding beta-propeller fold protein YncE
MRMSGHRPEEFMTRSLRFVLTVALSLTPGLLLATAGPAAATNGLRFIAVQKKSADGFALNGARGVAISPDAKHVYVASRNDDAVLVFARNAANGTLTLVETRKHVNDDGTANDDGLNGADAITVSPDGKHVYVGSDIDDTIVAFARWWMNQREMSVLTGTTAPSP